MDQRLINTRGGVFRFIKVPDRRFFGQSRMTGLGRLVGLLLAEATVEELSNQLWLLPNGAIQILLVTQGIRSLLRFPSVMSPRVTPLIFFHFQR